MLDTTKKVLYRFVFGANVATILLLWLCASSVYINPSISAIVGVMGLAFPAFFFANVCFLFLWLLFHWRTAWLPVVGFLCCIGSIRTYLPLNLPSPHPKRCIKVLSYNVMAFGAHPSEKPIYSYAARYIKESDADIVCLQEGAAISDEMRLNTLEELACYRHQDTVNHSSNRLVLLSRYPILKTEHIHYESEENVSAAFWLKIENDTVIVINNHLESNRLTMSDREMYKNLVKDPESMSIKQSSRFLASKIGQASKKRAYQADSVAAYIQRHKGYSMIVCGDFNDSPISYARYTICQGLTDTFLATGNGIGHSFNRDGIYVRIDHLFCTDDWEPYGAMVDTETDASDHYPISCYLQKKRTRK
ncbi:MAG: endonuclease/exonuclease/phosphatase family protein [Bacteroidaceae bacterium]